MGTLDFIPGIVKSVLNVFGTDAALNGDAVKVRLEGFEFDAIDGVVVHDGDVRITVPAQGLTSEPQVNDHIEVAGQPWRVVSIRRPYATDDVALYELHCRG